MELKRSFKLITFLLLGALTLPSCSDDDDDDDNSGLNSSATHGVYVINQGSYGSNNTSVSFLDYDSCKMYNNVFENANQRGLGDTGQDAVIYGDKMYIAVYQSNTIEIVDKKTCKSIKTIQTTEGQPEGPRDILAYNGKIYVSMYNGYVAKIDTASLSIEDSVKVGPNPEEMAIANGYLYVANSDGMNFNNSYQDGTTVSKINLSTFKEDKKITVALNPCKLCADSQGNVFLISMGDYALISSALQKISADDQVTTLSTTANFMAVKGTTLYIVKAPYGASSIDYIAINTLTGEAISNDFIQGEERPANPSAIAIDPNDGRILIGSYVSFSDYSSDGFVFEYTSDGKFSHKYNAGIGPSGFVF